MYNTNPTTIGLFKKGEYMNKKIIKIMLLVAVLGLAAGTLFSQNYYFDQEKLLEPVNKTLNFVFIAKLIHPWYKDVEKGAEYAIAEMRRQGIRVNMKWDSPATADINEHVKKIEANISSRPDGLAIACLDPATNTQVINDAFDAGLNVITFDTDAPDSKRILYVGHSGDYDDGFRCGETLAEKINYRGEVGIMVGSLGAPNHVNRVKGFKDAMKQYRRISIVFEAPDNDDIQKALDLTESALQALPRVAGIYCNNAANGIGTPRAVKNAGKSGKIVIIADSLMPEQIEFIKDGTIYMGNAQRQWDIGYWAVKYMVALNQNHTVPKVHPTGAMLCKKEDLIKWGILE
jgi:ribose transport system substrate-binding protein